MSISPRTCFSTLAPATLNKALVVSNDSDLVFPVRAVRERFGLSIGVSCPVSQRGRRPAWHARPCV